MITEGIYTQTGSDENIMICFSRHFLGLETIKTAAVKKKNLPSSMDLQLPILHFGLTGFEAVTAAEGVAG